MFIETRLGHFWKLNFYREWFSFCELQIKYFENENLKLKYFEFKYFEFKYFEVEYFELKYFELEYFVIKYFNFKYLNLEYFDLKYFKNKDFEMMWNMGRLRQDYHHKFEKRSSSCVVISNMDEFVPRG